ncbi:hypothetical protein PGRAN_02475 [Listeria grandensis FSL F6-0971]|uniref:Uncharacterized protein n=1 Tax=Listeria grandensis FSL F6-0971 TaxID=1265819 RepID=W7BC76_9LIST|nr:hypothetical protein [Listeria grandensis]EUJ24724.1 hypothetical protein PGRAN_02475 [Listeria grandensis FSL F6-0971]
MKTVTLKKSAEASEAMKHVKHIPQKQLASMMHTSRANISHLSTGKRKMQQDIAEQALKTIENGSFAVALLHRFSDGVTAPLLDGTAIDQHRLAFLAMFENETEEFAEVQHRLTLTLAKNPDQLNQDEKEQIRQFMNELIDVCTVANNALFNLAQVYNLSVKRLMNDRKAEFKKFHWIN